MPKKRRPSFTELHVTSASHVSVKTDPCKLRVVITKAEPMPAVLTLSGINSHPSWGVDILRAERISAQPKPVEERITHIEKNH